jgi:hypothetical protein
MTTLQLTEDQLRLVQKALDFYSRVGIGQMWAILEHPTYEDVLREKLRPKKQLEVGDRTERGEVVEIGDGFIKTRGSWGNGLEIRTWTDVENVKLSIDYSTYHELRKTAEHTFNKGRNIALQDDIPDNGSYGIYNPQVDESCRVAFDILKVIRHEFWKLNPNTSEHTVDAYVDTSTKDGSKIKCIIEK